MVSLEYAAGFIDADGCITCHINDSGNPTWELNAVQTVKNGTAMLDDFQERWGGNVCLRKKQKPHYSDQRKWKVQGIEAAIAISDIYHLLLVKKDKATQALEHFGKSDKISKILYRIGEPRP